MARGPKKARSHRAFLEAERLRGADVRCLWALWAGGHVERHALVLFERFESGVLNRRKVREYILAAAVRCDETEAFLFVEPLYRT